MTIERNGFRPRLHLLFVACATLGVALGPSVASRAENQGLGIPAGSSLADGMGKPKAVRNAAPVAGHGVTILRTFKIEKGAYPEFYRRSVDEIWPYFEKIGARIIGMWEVDAAAIDPETDRDFDEAVLLTRYASLEHWRASRSPFDLGGNGPDAAALAAAHAYRQSVTIETSFRVLRGEPARNGPYFMPAVDE